MKYGLGQLSHFGRMGSMVAALVEAITRKFLTFGGSEYIHIDAPVLINAGDTVSLDFVAAPAGVSRYIIDAGPSGAGRSYVIIEGSTNNLDYYGTAYSAATLDGVPIGDGEDMSSALDGAIHTLNLTATKTVFIGTIGAKYDAGQPFTGILANLILTVAGVPRTWAIGSGSTSTDDGLTHFGVVAGDWADFELNGSTSPDQWEETAPGVRIIPIAGA